MIILVFATSLGLIGLVGVYRAFQSAREVEPLDNGELTVRCKRLEMQLHQVTESFHGLIEARAKVDMAFQVPGRVMYLGPRGGSRLDESDRVSRGQVIGSIDDSRYESQLSAAVARREETQAAVTGADAAIAEAEARLEDAKLEYRRVQELHTNKAATTRELDKSKLTVDIARAHLSSAESQRASAISQHEKAVADVELSRVNLHDTKLLAPFDAVVGHIHVEIGQMVQAGEPVISLVDLDRVNLVLGVVERNLPLIEVGQAVEIEIPALKMREDRLGRDGGSGYRFTGRVGIVSPAAEVETGLFRAEVVIDNPNHVLRDGMVGKATIRVMETEVYIIPASSAEPVAGGVAVYFAEPVPCDDQPEASSSGGAAMSGDEMITAVARRVVISPIAVDRDHYLVASLPENRLMLVVAGQNRISDGQTIRILPPARSDKLKSVEQTRTGRQYPFTANRHTTGVGVGNADQ